MPSTVETICASPKCVETFKFKSNKKFCSKQCRDSAGHIKRICHEPRDLKVLRKRTDKRDAIEAFDTSYRLAEVFFDLVTDQERLSLCWEVLLQAHRGNTRLRRAITTPKLLRPECGKKMMLVSGISIARNIAQIIDRLCKQVFGTGTAQTLREGSFEIKEGVDLTSIDVSSLISRKQKFSPAPYPSITCLTAKLSQKPYWVSAYYKQVIELDKRIPVAA